MRAHYTVLPKTDILSPEQSDIEISKKKFSNSLMRAYYTVLPKTHYHQSNYKTTKSDPGYRARNLL